MSRGRKSKQSFVQYDYEAAYDKALKDLEEDQVKQILQGNRKATVYATKEVRSGNELEVEIYPEFTKQQKDQIPTEAQRKRQRQAQRNLNEKNSRKQCERIINENFNDGDIWATLTYTDDDMPETVEEAQKNMQKYIRRLNYQRKKQGLKNARYVYVTEGIEGGRFHHHIVMDGDMDMDTVEKLWTKGRRNQVRRLKKDDDGLTGMAKYITKEKKKKSQKKWTSSKGLRKPTEDVNHYKFRNSDVKEMVADPDQIENKMLKWYADKGYTFRSAEVKYNEVNGRFYVYARLHRQERTEESCRKRRVMNSGQKRGEKETRAGTGSGRKES